MSSLYALSIKGEMIYIIGEIDKSLYTVVDSIAKQIKLENHDIELTDFSDKFILQVYKLYGIKLK